MEESAAAVEGLGALVEPYVTPENVRQWYVLGSGAALVTGLAAGYAALNSGQLDSLLGWGAFTLLVVAAFTAPVAYARSHNSAAVFDAGFAVVTRKGTTSVRWEDIASVYVSIRVYRGRQIHQSRVFLRDGSTVKVNNGFHNAEDLMQRIQHGMGWASYPACRQAFERGETLSFGAVSLSAADGVTHGKKTLRWEHIEGVRLVGGTMAVPPSADAPMRMGISVAIEKLRDPLLCYALIADRLEGVTSVFERPRAAVAADDGAPDGVAPGAPSPTPGSGGDQAAADHVPPAPSQPPPDGGGRAPLGGHFGAIGIDMDRQMVHLSVMALESPAVLPLEDGTAVYVQRDASGAGLAVVADQGDYGQLHCVTPFFTASTAWPVRFEGVAADPTCHSCDGVSVSLMQDGEFASALVFQLVAVDAVRDALPAPGTDTTAYVTAFVQELERWPSIDAYEAHEAGQGSPGFAVRSMLPLGMFVEDGGAPLPRAVVTGVVAEVERRVHEAAGNPFVRLLIDSYPGAWELVASVMVAPDDLTPGQVVRATCWTVGELAETATP